MVLKRVTLMGCVCACFFGMAILAETALAQYYVSKSRNQTQETEEEGEPKKRLFRFKPKASTASRSQKKTYRPPIIRQQPQSQKGATQQKAQTATQFSTQTRRHQPHSMPKVVRYTPPVTKVSQQEMRRRKYRPQEKPEVQCSDHSYKLFLSNLAALEKEGALIEKRTRYDRKDGDYKISFTPQEQQESREKARAYAKLRNDPIAYQQQQTINRACSRRRAKSQIR